MPYTGHCYTKYPEIKKGLVKKTNFLWNRCQIFTSGDQVFKGKQEHPPGIGQIWHRVCQKRLKIWPHGHFNHSWHLLAKGRFVRLGSLWRKGNRVSGANLSIQVTFSELFQRGKALKTLILFQTALPARRPSTAAWYLCQVRSLILKIDPEISP